MVKKPWEDPEEKFNKKIRKIGRNAAYAFGGSTGLWLLAAFYPKEEGSEKITHIISNISLILFIYGTILIAAIITKKKLAPAIYLFVTWIIMPIWIGYLFMQASGKL